MSEMNRRVIEFMEREGPRLVKKWNADYQKNLVLLRIRKQKIYEQHLKIGFRLENRYESRRTKRGDKT